MPLGIILYEIYKSIKSSFEGEDWMLSTPGKVFFIRPDGMIEAFMWKTYITTQLYVGHFFLTGTNDEAIEGSW